MKVKKLTIYKADGSVVTETAEITLEKLQSIVGGYIEYVRLPRGNGHKKMVVNEEGLLVGLPLNITASLMAKQSIVGDVVVY